MSLLGENKFGGKNDFYIDDNGKPHASKYERDMANSIIQKNKATQEEKAKTTNNNTGGSGSSGGTGGNAASGNSNTYANAPFAKTASLGNSLLRVSGPADGNQNATASSGKDAGGTYDSTSPNGRNDKGYFGPKLVNSPAVTKTFERALGSALLYPLASGKWNDSDYKKVTRINSNYEPMPSGAVDENYNGYPSKESLDDYAILQNRRRMENLNKIDELRGNYFKQYLPYGSYREKEDGTIEYITNIQENVGTALDNVDTALSIAGDVADLYGKSKAKDYIEQFGDYAGNLSTANDLFGLGMSVYKDRVEGDKDFDGIHFDNTYDALEGMADGAADGAAGWLGGLIGGPVGSAIGLAAKGLAGQIIDSFNNNVKNIDDVLYPENIHFGSVLGKFNNNFEENYRQRVDMQPAFDTGYMYQVTGKLPPYEKDDLLDDVLYYRDPLFEGYFIHPDSNVSANLNKRGVIEKTIDTGKGIVNGIYDYAADKAYGDFRDDMNLPNSIYDDYYYDDVYNTSSDITSWFLNNYYKK